MSPRLERSRTRALTPREAAALVRPDDRLGVPLGPGQPLQFLRALGERDDFTRLTVFAALLIDLYPLFTRQGVRLQSAFFGPIERGLRAAGHDVEFLPQGFRAFGDVARRLAPRVMATAAAPPRDGRVSLALHAGATTEELVRCGRDPQRLLIVEVNARLPRTRGLLPDHPHSLALADVDVLIEVDHPPFALADPEPTPEERAIAQTACSFIPHGATLQTGIGGIPSGVARILAAGDGGDYGIHSEMFTTGLMHLQRSGRVSNRKGCFDGRSIATFALGTPELYAWLDERDDVVFLPVEVVNDPAIIARNRQMISINGALAIDLQGQVAADRLGAQQYSGVGGHEDFLMGAAPSGHGRTLVCLPSTARVGGERVSRIAAHFEPGTAITSPRHHVDVVITEHGAAELWGRTAAERAEALVAIAHPDFRDGLREAANRLGLSPAGRRAR
jgi:acyl-CoA hydrolase